MATTPSLAKRLARDHPEVTFIISSDDCAWNPQQRTITYQLSTTPAELLHELGHALLGHASYMRDVELLSIERDAWEYAITTLASRYGIVITLDDSETALDSYRDWLHKRSSCPQCHLNGIQESSTVYRCLHCHTRWHVNEARTCRLQRKKLPS